MTEEKNEVISCQTCIYKDLQKTPESKCYPKENELQFNFCNYQKNKKLEEK